MNTILSQDEGMPGKRAAFLRSVDKHPSNSEPVRGAILNLLKFAEQQASPIPNQPRVTWGAAQNGSFHYRVWVGMKPTTLFTCDSGGYVTVSIGNFTSPWTDSPFDVPVREFVRELSPFKGFENLTQGKYVHRPGLSMNDPLTQKPVMAKFQSAVLQLQRRIEG